MEITQVCQKCGSEFTYISYGGGKRKYCSASCARRKDTSNTYKRLSDNNHKGALAAEIIARYGGRCAICGWRATEELITHNGHTQKAYGNEIHHIIAVKDGGKATEDNLLLLCPNHHKQADLGLIPLDELRNYRKPPLTAEQKQAMRDACVDAITAAILGD